MSLDNLEELHFLNLLDCNGFCSATLGNLFGNNLDWNWLKNIKFNDFANNLWGWRMHSCKASVAFTTYEHAISLDSLDDSWMGWSVIWKLPILPHAKVFLCSWENYYWRVLISDQY